MTAVELGAGTVALTALAPLLVLWMPAFDGQLLALPGPRDGTLLLVLALGCTLLPFALSLVALRHLSAYTVQLATNLEPVYAIVLAAVLLGEQRELTTLFYLGVALILGVVFLDPLLARRQRPAAAGAPEVQHPEMLGTSEAKQMVD